MSGISVRVLLRYLNERSYDDFAAAARACGFRLIMRRGRYKPLTDLQAKKLIAHYRLKSRGPRTRGAS